MRAGLIASFHFFFSFESFRRKAVSEARLSLALCAETAAAPGSPLRATSPERHVTPGCLIGNEVTLATTSTCAEEAVCRRLPGRAPAGSGALSRTSSWRRPSPLFSFPSVSHCRLSDFVYPSPALLSVQVFVVKTREPSCTPLRAAETRSESLEPLVLS